jgi:hypothetical protein
MKNERRKRRAASRLLAERFEAETREFNALPLELGRDMVAKAYVLNSFSHLHPLTCRACGGGGFKERRGRPRETVPCRVCQGTGLIQRRPDDDRLLGMRPSKIYWRGRRWWRHWSP